MQDGRAFANQLEMDISATYIRDCIQNGKSIEYLLPDAVKNYIEEAHLYK